MELLKLAPWALSYDFWIAIAFCYGGALPWMFNAYKASKSGSEYLDVLRMKWVQTKENMPIYKSGYFWFSLLWIGICSIFFWALLWPQHHDVWFQ